MNNRNIIDERAAYTKRAQDYTELIKRFSALELSTVGNYKIISEIGSGAFGQVYLGYHKLVRCKVCLKKGNRKIATNGSTNNSNNDNLMREFYYLREFRQHPHITKLYEIIFTESSVYMILEYYPSGDLFEYVTTNQHLSVDESLRIFTQIVGAVYFLHKSGCCHRDLKLENVLLDKHLNVKLSDFGFTRELPFAQYGTKSLLSEYCGTGAYMAPEIVQRVPYSGIKIDIWALGVMFYTMITGEMPFDDSLEFKELEYAIIHNKPRYLESMEILDAESSDKLQEIKFLLNGMLSKDPENRIFSLEDVLKLPLLESYGGQFELATVNKLHYDASYSKDWTTNDKTLFKKLVSAGIDREILQRSIEKETLDSVYGLWALLKDQSENKKNKSLKKSKRKNRSMLKLTSSRNIIGSAARQAFSASPSQSTENLTLSQESNAVGGGLSHLMSRTGSSNTAAAHSSTDGSLMRSTSFKKVRDLVMGPPETPKKLNSIHEKKEKADVGTDFISPSNNNNKHIDQSSLFSKSTQKSSSIHSKKKKITSFSLFNIFKSKPQGEEKGSEKKKSLDSDFLLNRIITNNTVNTASSKSKRYPNEYAPESSAKKVIFETSSVDGNVSKQTPKLDYTNASDENVLMTPDNLKLKRTEPTRPVSMLSAFSNHTSISETSNGSGYITGYSTDNNILVGQNTGNLPLSVSADAYQSIYSPQASARPKFSRGVSEWSVNISSQAESPNSSFTALSRSNSIDSLSRSISSRKKDKNMVFMKRGRSPLNSKVHAKWAMNSVSMTKKKPFIKQDKSQIIEEESSGEDQEEDRDQEEHQVFTGQNMVRKTVHSPVVRPSRSYMRKGSMKFPSLPVTEEDDDSHDTEDEADLEEDNHEYSDVVTENSYQESNKHTNLQVQANSSFNNTIFPNNRGLEDVERTNSNMSDNSLFNDKGHNHPESDKARSLSTSLINGVGSLNRSCSNHSLCGYAANSDGISSIERNGTTGDGENNYILRSNNGPIIDATSNNSKNYSSVPIPETPSQE
ncbi:hypothetical protein C6P42_003509 [Pichia californica]|nr:hypothetical protein C6P42_003509 [[Candida] californica]